jgi:hypothetical protein
VRLRIRRLGGIAGVKLRTELDTSELPDDRSANVEATIRGLRGRAPSGPPRPDGFRYEIADLDDPDSTPLTIEERDVPEPLAPLIEAVSQSGEIERPERG